MTSIVNRKSWKKWTTCFASVVLVLLLLFAGLSAMRYFAVGPSVKLTNISLSAKPLEFEIENHRCYRAFELQFWSISPDKRLWQIRSNGGDVFFDRIQYGKIPADTKQLFPDGETLLRTR